MSAHPDDLRTGRDGRSFFWRGHLCEGARLVPGNERTFCLWTRCGRHDVPACGAVIKEDGDAVTCQECLKTAARVLA